MVKIPTQHRGIRGAQVKNHFRRPDGIFKMVLLRFLEKFLVGAGRVRREEKRLRTAAIIYSLCSYGPVAGTDSCKGEERESFGKSEFSCPTA